MISEIATGGRGDAYRIMRQHIPRLYTARRSLNIQVDKWIFIFKGNANGVVLRTAV